MDNFRKIEKIGSGSYSTVYKATRISDGVTYAIKKVFSLVNVGSNGQSFAEGEGKRSQ